MTIGFAHPTAEWIAQQITEAFPWTEIPRYLIRDRDGIYGAAVSRRLRAINRWIEEERRVQVFVRDNNVDQALKVLKKKMQREGIFREMKLRGHYEKPSEKKTREKAEAICRILPRVRQ